MPIYRSQFTVETADSVAANYATNTWHCEAGDVTGAISFNTAVANFYAGVDGEFSTLVKATNGLRWKTYDLADLEPRAPVATGVANLVISLQPGLPPETSLCVSFQAALQSGVPQSRRRGRIYLPYPPQSTIGTDGRPSSAYLTTVTTAADALVTSSKAATTWYWGVYSPTSNVINEVDNGWVDNEWDTQRRRGRVRTTRSIFS